MNIDTIDIDHNAIFELYHGKKNAKPNAHKKIIIQSINLKLIIFHTIFVVSDLLDDISRIAIVYNQRSAKKTNIQI